MKQNIIVFQQNGSGEKKIKGIRTYGNGQYSLEIISIDELLPDILDDTSQYLPKDIKADLVLDFLKHPDLSQDLVEQCHRLDIPIIASGKKWPKAITPPT
jgi:thymidylate synthase